MGPERTNSLITPIEDAVGRGIRVTVKDLVDVVGYPTTGGSRVVAEEAQPATQDAACLAGLRAAERAGTARLVGKANMHEFAAGPDGVNPWFGTPVNPYDPSRVPGGSSSGSAAGVGAGEADVSYGSDTGGSIRIPSACCGTTGLKTTWGRVSLDGIMPMATSFDTIGPMARDVAGVVAGMQLLEPGFVPSADAATTVGRVRVPGVDPRIDAAIDEALQASELDVVDVGLDWDQARNIAVSLICTEFYADYQPVFERSGERIGAEVRALYERGRTANPDEVEAANVARRAWTETLTGWFDRVQVLALPVLKTMPATLEEHEIMYDVTCTTPVNLASVPALAFPVPAADTPVPPSVQLVGPMHSEELLVTTAAVVERAAAVR
jgi:amidase